MPVNDDVNANVQVAVRLSLLEDKVDRLLMVISEQDTRQRNMDTSLARRSVITGFVSAMVSGSIAFLFAMLRGK